MQVRSVLFVLLGFTSPALAQAPDRWQPVRDSIEKQLQRGGAAMAVAVAKDGKIIWEQGFGWANREKMIPANQHTMFSLASISKPVTATGLMVLVQRGKVDLDRPANDYLGAGKISGLAGDAAQATVRRVMSHTAGLPLHYQFFYANEPVHPATMDETIARYGILVSAPGETFRYSNLGYGIIDYIISRTSGLSYPEFMRREVFLPLGLTHTSIDIGPGLEDFAAERYDQNGRPIPFYTFDHNGGSAVYSSAHDLVRFGMFHLQDHLADQRQILSDTTLNAMRQWIAKNPFGDSAASYGLGWELHKGDHGYPSFEHTGGMPGVATALNLYPSEHLAVVALTNGGGNPFAIAQDIAAVLLPRYGDSLRADRAARARRPTPPPTPKWTAPSELVGRWSGTLKTWQSTVPFELVVEADGDVKAQIGEPATGPFDTRHQPQGLVSGAEWRDHVFTGYFGGTIPTPDASRVPNTVLLELRLVDGKLRGSANANSATTPVYFSAASYLELTKR